MGVHDTKAHKGEVKMKPKVRRTHVEFNNRKDERKRDLDVLSFIQKGEGSKKLKKEWRSHTSRHVMLSFYMTYLLSVTILKSHIFTHSTI